MPYFNRTSNCPILSVFLPSRNRFDMCKNTLNSFYTTCSNANNLQAIVKFDVDDFSSINRIQEIVHYPNIVILISDRKKGYKSLHTFCNEMLNFAIGDWVLFINDDSLMITQNWDVILESVSPNTHKSVHGRYTGEDKHLPLEQKYSNFEGSPNVALINPGSPNELYTTVFPIVRRTACDYLKYFSTHTHVDAFLQDVYHRLHASLNVPEIKIKHLCNEVKDQTRLETAAAQGTSMNDFSYGACEIAANKLRELL